MDIEGYKRLSRLADDPRRVLDLTNLSEPDTKWIGDALDRLILDEDRGSTSRPAPG